MLRLIQYQTARPPAQTPSAIRYQNDLVVELQEARIWLPLVTLQALWASLIHRYSRECGQPNDLQHDARQSERHQRGNSALFSRTSVSYATFLDGSRSAPERGDVLSRGLRGVVNSGDALLRASRGCPARIALKRGESPARWKLSDELRSRSSRAGRRMPARAQSSHPASSMGCRA